MDGIIANERCALQIDLRIERIARIEVEKALRNFQPTKGQSCFHVFEANQALQSGPQSRAGKMQVHEGPAIREISSNEKRVLGFDCHVEFPIANRRLRDRKIRTFGRWLRSGTPRQTDRNQIDVLEKLTVR